jgi:hypothetical protein
MPVIGNGLEAAYENLTLNNLGNSCRYWNPKDGPFHFGRAYAPAHDAKTLHYTARRYGEANLYVLKLAEAIEWGIVLAQCKMCPRTVRCS